MNQVFIFTAGMALKVLLASVIIVTTVWGKEADFGEAIVNGKDSKPGQFPFIAYLEIKRPGKISDCGGTLISDQWILTAAHCVYNGVDVQVSLGAHKRTDVLEPGRKNYTTKEIIVHEQYHPPVTNDVALLKLPEKVKFTDRIQPASLPPDNTLLDGKPVEVAGWGLLSTQSGKLADILQYAEMKVISNKECRKSFKDVTDKMLCTKGDHKESTCDGDSGGPLVLKGSKTLVGVINFGDEESCDLGYPSFYSRVSSYVKWIREKTGVQG